MLSPSPKYPTRHVLHTRVAMVLVMAGLAVATPHAAAQGMPPGLTAVGAEREGTRDGLVPAFGTSAASGKADSLLFEIDATNVERYASLLSPGQRLLIQRVPGYTMRVYPAERSCSFPAQVLKRTEAERGRARVRAEDNAVVAVPPQAIPFPTPRNGAEVMWNHRLRYLGQGLEWTYATVVPPKSGDRMGEPMVTHEQVLWPLALPDAKRTAATQGADAYFINTTEAPAALAGDAVLAHSFIDKPADLWLYFSSQRRLRRAPTYGYDAPILNLSNLMTVDAFAMFSGPLDRYDFKLLGKAVMLVPYHWEALADPKRPLADRALPRFLNRELARYEHHRVWVVEARVKPDMRHQFPRRVFYVDEDTWGVVVQDLFDAQDQVQRVMESGPVRLPQLSEGEAFCGWHTYVSHDLAAGRYVADRLPVGKVPDWRAGREGRIAAVNFEPDALRRRADR